MKKLLSIMLISLMLIALLTACGTSENTDTSTDTNTDVGSKEDNVFYEQVNGGKYLKSDPSLRDSNFINYSPYKIIYTYEEFMESAENASNIDSSIFEENAIIYIRQIYGYLVGESLGYSNLKMIDGVPFITYSKYGAEDEFAAEVVTKYEDYVVIPKGEIPKEMYQFGVIGIFVDEIYLYAPKITNKVEGLPLSTNSACILKTKEQVDGFAEAYGLEEKSYPSEESYVVAIYARRPSKKGYAPDGTIIYEGYFLEREENVLKISYLYDENDCSETEYYVDFIRLYNGTGAYDNIDSIEVEVKARQNPVSNIATGYDIGN